MRAFSEFIPIPEETGIVMVIEKEFGPQGAGDWAKIAAGLVDIVKCTFGTGALYDEDVLRRKVEVYKDAGISPMIGGTLTEVAMLSARRLEPEQMRAYLKYAGAIGFTYIEFSDGSIYVPDEMRRDIIHMCIDQGFRVISEVGKKDPEKDALITTDKRIELMNADIESGAEMVIIESRESGKGLGVISKAGDIDFAVLDDILGAVGMENTMIEAPQKQQQQSLYIKYGPKINVGNVQPPDVLSVGALRTGLRGDTISALRRQDWQAYHRAVGAPDIY